MTLHQNSKQRAARLTAAAALTVLVTGAIAGCAQAGATPAAPSLTPASADSSTPSSTPTPSSTTAAALSCDDLVSKADIITALAAGQPADDWVVLPTSSAEGSIDSEKAVEGAGGLSCSWRAGPPNSETGEAVLTVSILPDAAKQWTGQLYGDGPTSDRRTFAGISAAATCGDPGCGATAAVGSSWVRVDLITGSREGGESAFAKETDDQVFDGLTPAVESVFRTVQDASAADLRFPDHLPSGGAVDCRNYLKKATLSSVLGVKDVRFDTTFAPNPQTGSIFAAAQLRIGESVCIVEDPQYSNAVELASVTVGPDQAWAVDELASNPDERGDLRETRLEGQVSGERALSSCGSSGNQCTVVFTLSSDAIQIEDTDRAVQVAEAIIAAAR